MPVPPQSGAAGRWSLDHLLLDDQAILTLVEVKRSSDTRLRREVVGQMLDYAANGVAYWTVDEIRARYESTCQQMGRDPNQLIMEVADDDDGVESFWDCVRTNLEARNIRLVFAADAIPLELRQIIEFLNDSMPSVEVMGVEIKQFLGEGQVTIVPRVVGQTAKSAARKQKSTSMRQLSEREYFQGVDQEHAISVARRLMQIAEEEGAKIDFGFGGRGIPAACPSRKAWSDVLLRRWQTTCIRNEASLQEAAI